MWARLGLRPLVGRAAPLAAHRLMSTRVIAHVVGPDRVGILAEVSRVITSHGGKIHDTRATSLGGTFSVTTEVELGEDSSAMAFALQTKLPDFITCMRPESDIEAASAVFGRIEVSEATAMGVISQMTEHVASRGVGFATLRTSEYTEGGTTTFSMTATLSAAGKVDTTWLTAEFMELGDKLNCRVEFNTLPEE